jgi:hypothetical protein
MQKVIINYDKAQISSFNAKKQTWETCSLYEAGIPDDVTDREEIEERLTEHENIQIEWRYDSQLTLDEFIAHFGWNPTEDKELNISQNATYEIRDGIAAVHVGNQQFGTFEY